MSPPEGNRRRNAGSQEMGSGEGPFPEAGMGNLALVPTEMGVDPFLISSKQRRYWKGLMTSSSWGLCLSGAQQRAVRVETLALPGCGGQADHGVACYWYGCC